MKFGQIILVPFPFAELTNTKVRPAVVIGETEDRFKDLIIAAISSVVPNDVPKKSFVVKSSSISGLRVDSLIKVDRLATIKSEQVIATIGKLTPDEKQTLKKIFKSLVD
ncbi:MAG: type II toxin-antitoxin system PemK/MazF family toxin [Cyclobacteriaceae bacterium]